MTFIQLGTTTHWGTKHVLGLKTDDMRRHLYLVGKTGCGKSTLLKEIIVQLLEQGNGFALLDPHGDLAEEVLRHIPPFRRDDVCYFSPGDAEHPVSLNLLTGIPENRRALYASGMVSSFKAIWRDSWGPRMEYILYNGISALLDCQNVSLLSLGRMLNDGAYRDWVVKQVRDPGVRAFWEVEFRQYDPRFAREAVSPILNKVGPFLTNPLLRNILGQVKRKVDLRQLMDNRGIFIANLSKGLVGESSANLLGSLLAGLFQFEALGRVDQEEVNRVDFHLIMDEFHNFTTDAFSGILSEARKYRLNLVMAHQYLDQLKPEVLSAVLGNVGTLMSFTVGHSDAKRLAPELGDYQVPAYVDLDRFRTICRATCDGKLLQAKFVDMDLRGTDPYDHAEKIRGMSRQRFAEPRHEVEEKIKRWYEARYTNK